jgi:signal transduction histidine kinase
LGLFIARWIVERHKGEVEVNSQTGQGTTVVVRLPLQPRPSAARQPV